jgi:hypothetical protein
MPKSKRVKKGGTQYLGNDNNDKLKKLELLLQNKNENENEIDILKRELKKRENAQRELNENAKQDEVKLLDVLASNEALSTMRNLLFMSDMKKVLMGDKSRTLLLPTNDDIKNSGLDVEQLKQNKEAVNKFVREYVVKDNINTKTLDTNVPVVVKNENGKRLDIVKNTSGQVVISHEGQEVAKIVSPHVLDNNGAAPSNGAVHSIENTNDTIKKNADNAVQAAANKFTDQASTAAQQATAVATNAFKNFTSVFSGGKRHKRKKTKRKRKSKKTNKKGRKRPSRKSKTRSRKSKTRKSK